MVDLEVARRLQLRAQPRSFTAFPILLPPGRHRRTATYAQSVTATTPIRGCDAFAGMWDKSLESTGYERLFPLFFGPFPPDATMQQLAADLAKDCVVW